MPRLCGTLERTGCLVVECGRDELTAAVAQGGNHVAATLRRGPPARFLDEPGHGRSDALALRDESLHDFGEGLHLVGSKEMASRIYRVRREVEAEGVALGGHALGDRP